MGFGNKGGGGFQPQEGYSDKVPFNWHINNILQLVNFSTAMDNKYGVVRLIKQLHFTLASVWDEEYIKAHKQLMLDAANAGDTSEYGEKIREKDRFEFDVALHIHAEQIKLMARNNLLPQKDMETTIDGPPITDEVLPEYLARPAPVPVPVPDDKNDEEPVGV